MLAPLGYREVVRDAIVLAARLKREAQRRQEDGAYDWRRIARPAQLPPDGDWRIWLVLAGRGWGKTRTGAEYVRMMVEAGRARRIALVAQDAGDARDVMVEGVSGILEVCPPWSRPKYEPSKRRLTWPNGAVATTYAADDPDALRGPEHDLAWVDELCKWRRPDAAWTNLQLGLRQGEARCIVTTTPRPIPLLKSLLAREDIAITRGHTLENKEHLSPSFLEEILARYEGTTLGRQELAGEVLQDVEGALWRRSLIDAARVEKAPELERVVVAVDPSGTEDGNEQGIVVAGIGSCECRGEQEQHVFVLEDVSTSATPLEWARRVVMAYHRWRADRVVAEVNYGGQMVEATLRQVDPTLSYRAVSATRGKQVRAEPVAALYEQGKVHHVGALPELEDQLCTWQPGERSPDRLDALVWAVTDLALAGRIVRAY